MLDAFRIFNTAEHQVIILGTIIFASKPTYFIYNFFLHNKKVCNIVVRIKQIRAPIRLKIRIHMFGQIT